MWSVYHQYTMCFIDQSLTEMPSLRELRIGSSWSLSYLNLSLEPLREQLELLEIPALVSFKTEGRWENLKTLHVIGILGRFDKRQPRIEAAEGWAPHLRKLRVHLEV